MKGKKLVALTAIIYMVFLVACSASWLAHFSMEELINLIAGTVPFQEGVFKKDSTELAVVLHDGETAILDEFANLRQADLRGSRNIDEIYDWAQRHPNVTVLYNLTLPNGLKVDNNARTLDFTGITAENLSAFSGLMPHFPDAESIDLGGTGDTVNPMSPAELSGLISAHPDKSFSYRVQLGDIQFSLSDMAIDLTTLKSADVDKAAGYLSCMPGLSAVMLGDDTSCALSMDEIGKLCAAAPQAQFEYSFDLYGKRFSLSDEVIDLSHVPVGDQGEAVKAALRCMPNCKTLDMDSCGLTDPEMAAIREEFPEVDVIWRVWFGLKHMYSVRTDTTRILASKPSDAGNVTDYDVQTLSYCTKVKYLDLGHNDVLTDISFVSNMPDLEVLIIAMNYISDISALADCPKLEYLEIFSTPIIDLSPLANSKALRHLNISNCYITDISPLFGLTELERLWVGNQTPVPVEQLQQMQAAAPQCVISIASNDPHGDHWRELSYDINYHTYTWTPRYELLRQQLGYDYQQYSFYWLDPKSGLEAPPEFAGKYYIHEDQLNGLGAPIG